VARDASAAARREPDAEPVAAPGPPPADLTAAAFFDVDNTLVQGSSLVHFGRGLAARKYFTYGDMAKFIYAQAKFQLTGRENSEDVAEGGARRWRSSRAAPRPS
jgi:phosphoserine phosphatase